MIRRPYLCLLNRLAETDHQFGTTTQEINLQLILEGMFDIPWIERACGFKSWGQPKNFAMADLIVKHRLPYSGKACLRLPAARVYVAYLSISRAYAEQTREGCTENK